MPSSGLWEQAQPGWRSAADMQRVEAWRAETNVRREGVGSPEPPRDTCAGCQPAPTWGAQSQVRRGSTRPASAVPNRIGILPCAHSMLLSLRRAPIRRRRIGRGFARPATPALGARAAPRCMVPRSTGCQPVPNHHRRRCWCRLTTCTYSGRVCHSCPSVRAPRAVPRCTVPRSTGFQPVPNHHRRRCWCRLTTCTYSGRVRYSCPSARAPRAAPRCMVPRSTGFQPVLSG